MPSTSTSTPAEADPFESVRSRNRLVEQVRAALSGSGLDIRERTSALVISNPGHPDNGRVYITYVSADVSLRRPLWHYLGRLQEHHRDADPEADPTVDAAAIIAALTSSLDTPAEADPPMRASQQASTSSAREPEGA